MTAWLICNMSGQYRRTKFGDATPPLRTDEYAYRVYLPDMRAVPRQVIRLVRRVDA